MCPSIPPVPSGCQINLSLGSCMVSWERSRLFGLLLQARHPLATSLLQAEPASERFPNFFPFLPPSREGAGWEQSQPARPGQVLCTLPRPLCQRKHKHPTQRKHFSSATQVPIFAQGRPVLGSIPHRIPGLSQSPAQLSGLGFGQSHPSHPTLDPLKPVNVTTSEIWRGFKLV